MFLIIVIKYNKEATYRNEKIFTAIGKIFIFYKGLISELQECIQINSKKE